MMGRSPFYAPFPGMWSGAFGATSGSKQSSYSTSSGNGAANFGYPPTPPKDGTPDNHQAIVFERLIVVGHED